MGALLIVGVLVAVSIASRPTETTIDAVEGATQPIAADPSGRDSSIATTSPPDSSHVSGLRGGARTAAGQVDSIRVVDESGRAIVGAAASMTRTNALLPEFRLSWPWSDPTVLAKSTEFVLTNSDGAVRFETPASEPHVVWVTAVGRQPWSGDLASVPSDGIVLHPKAELRVRVVDARGDPIPGAIVTQRLSLNDTARAQLGVSATARSMCLLRSSTTDERGRVALSDLGGGQIVDAVHGTLRSLPWYGIPPAEVDLRVAPSFTWSGSVIAPDASFDARDVRVRLDNEGAGRHIRIGIVPVRADGSFGPCTSAQPGAGTLRFELDGGPWIPTTVERPLADDDAHVEVQITATRGVRFPVLVVDPSGAPIARARVDWAWNSGGEAQWAMRTTDQLGMAELAGAPLGPILLMVEAAGRQPFRVDLNVTAATDEPYRVQLAAGGKLMGRVTAHGSPVEEFTIVHRRANSYNEFFPTEFRDRKDGTYEIDGLPVGDIFAFAMSPDRPRTPDRSISLAPEIPGLFDFELGEGLVGRGIVHDAATGEPIEGASAQVFSAEGWSRIREQGVPTIADASGRFEVSGLAADASSIVAVSAKGYAVRDVMVGSPGSGPVALGVVGLAKPRSITVQLVLPLDADHSKWTASVGSGILREPRSFPASGELRFEGLSAGSHSVTVVSSTGRTETRPGLVTPDVDTLVRFEPEKGARFVVEIDGSAIGGIPKVCWLNVRTFADSHRVVREFFLLVPADGVVEVSGVQEPRVWIGCIDQNRDLAAVTRATRDVDGQRFRMELVSKPGTVGLVDHEGNPLPNVVVGFGSSDAGWAVSGVTDTSGTVTLEAANSVVDVYVLRAPDGGGIVRGVRVGADPTILTVDLRASIALRLVDGTEPVLGASMWIEDGYGLRSVFPTLTTDAAGEARSRGYLAHSFRALVRSAGIWPVDLELDATLAGIVQEFQVRRRGSVILHATRGGLPLRGASLVVTSDEYATAVTDWIASGAVTSSSVTCTTDDRGQLRLDGVPRGPYRWRTVVENGVEVGGRFDVLPSRRVDVDITVP